MALLVGGAGLLLLEPRGDAVGAVPGPAGAAAEVAGAAGWGEAIQVAAATLVGALRGGEDGPFDGDVAALGGERVVSGQYLESTVFL